MICLSKNLTDEYVNMFAQGAGLPIQDYDADYGNNPILIRSMGKRKLIRRCQEKNHTFYYMDSGYVGNYKSTANPHGWKLYHRIVKNDVQHNKIIDRPDDRWRKLDYPILKRKQGNHILLVTPSEKPCKFYGIDRDLWVNETVAEIKKHTDRPIVIRDKAVRQQRITKTIFEDLENCHALVTYQSIAAVESVLYGVPAFTLAPTAADPVCDKDVSLIECPTHQDEHKIYKWACHLAYGQFHVDEFKNGTAYKLLMDTTQ
jgi:ribosomal protein S6